MSSYAEYEVLSKEYDGTRRPQGAHLYLGLVYAMTKKTAQNLHLLDLGCGTGNHVKYLLEDGLGRATVFDANVGMLEKSKAKLKRFVDEGRVVIEQHKLPDIPYEDNTFDVVMCNQVLHHLMNLTDDNEHVTIRKVLEEAHRVLKPNGVFLVNLCTPYQCWHGYWYASLFPNSNQLFSDRVVEQKKFLSMLRESGFQNEGMIVEPLDMVYEEKRYFKEDGPLDEQWRNADSMTAVLTPEELESAKKKVLKLKEEGTLREYMLQADAMREHVGQYAIYHAKKSSSST